MQSSNTKSSVHSYDAHCAVLVLKEHYPATAQNVPTALLKLDNVLETLNHELVEVGAWINVIGYIRTQSSAPTPVHGGAFTGKKPKVQSRPSLIEATMIWSAGAIQLQKYSSAVNDYQAASSGAS